MNAADMKTRVWLRDGLSPAEIELLGLVGRIETHQGRRMVSVPCIRATHDGAMLHIDQGVADDHLAIPLSLVLAILPWDTARAAPGFVTMPVDSQAGN